MVVAQTLSKIFQSSRIQWSSKIGRMHYRNSMAVFDDDLIISSSGSVWNEVDNADGVYRVSIEHGKIIWHLHTRGDANGVCIINRKYAVGGTDLGQVFAVEISTGKLAAEFTVSCPVYSKPIAIYDGKKLQAVTISRDGDIICFDPVTVSFRVAGNIRGEFRVDLATDPILLEDGIFLTASESGEVIKARLDSGSVDLSLLYNLEDKDSSYGDYKVGVRGVGSLSIDNGKVFIAYLRDTYDKHPPICCVDISTGKKVWDAKAVKSVSKKENSYGNSRVSPIISGDYLLSTFGYNGSLHVFSKKTGKGQWLVRLDGGLFQNWASPVMTSEGRVLVPRVNGVVFEVDIKMRLVVSSTSVEIGRYVDSEDYFLRKRHFAGDSWSGSETISSELIGKKQGPDPHSILVAGIASTPLVTKDSLIVGGVSGELRCFRL